MRSTICISASLCVWAAAGLAEALPGPGACFQQRYDAAHLAAHPQQGVAELHLWFFDTEPGVTPSRSVIAAARMASQGQGARDGVGGLTLRATLHCAIDATGLPRCFHDCDGGAIALETLADGGLLVSTEDAVLGAPESCGGTSNLSDGGLTRYQLVAAPAAACADLATPHPLPEPGCYGVAYSRADPAGTVAAMTLHLGPPDPAFGALAFPWLHGQLAIDVAPSAPGMGELAGARVMLPIWCASDSGACHTLHAEDGIWRFSWDGAELSLVSSRFLLFDDLDQSADLTRGMQTRHALAPLPAESCAGLISEPGAP